MKKKKGILFLFCTTLVILYIVIYIFPNVTGAFVKTEIIEYGSIQEAEKVTAYFIRSENVYFANKSGNIKYNVQEGEMVRKGTEILDIATGTNKDKESSYQNILERVSRFNGGESIFSGDVKEIDKQLVKLVADRDAALDRRETEQAARLDGQIKRLSQKMEYLEATDLSAKKEIIKQNKAANKAGIIPDNYISSINGIVSFYIDGYESEFTPESMTLLSRDKVQRLDNEIRNVARDKTLTKEPLYKIVDNKKWYALFWIAPENIVKYEKGHSVKINLPLGQVEGKIYDVIDNKDQWLVILEFNKYYEDFAKIRKIDTEVITSDCSGLIIRNKSITSKDGTTGVYVKDKNGEYTFRQVKIITTNGEWSLVEVSYFYTDDGSKKIETVNIYDEILIKPN